MREWNGITTNDTRENIQSRQILIVPKKRPTNRTSTGSVTFMSSDVDIKYKQIVNEEAEVARILNQTIIAKFS